ncbi:triphosphoribosyl-dephospho-CoA synthase [Halorubrum gandharaense]
MTDPTLQPPARDPTDDAVLALLLEVSGTPKPGNVDRTRDLDDLHFEAFLGGAVGARKGLEMAATGNSLGTAFERAVAGMADRAGTNTQFGCLLLLVPLIAAASKDDLSPESLDRVTRSSTVDDAVAFYRAFEHVDVAVGDPPAEAADLDVRRGGDAEPALRERGLSLRDVLALSATPDDGGSEGDIPDRNAQEWVEGFPRTFREADRIRRDSGPLTDRAARTFVRQLAAEPDTLVATNHGPAVARDASRRAAELVGQTSEVNHTNDAGGAPPSVDLDGAEELAEAFVAEGINPGTTADLTCAALFVALRRGAEVGR